MSTAFFDIDTQIDFLFPAGALYVPGAERLLPGIRRLNRLASSRGFPVVSTMCAHSENDPEFRTWRPHCVVGTPGQKKPQETLLERSAVIPNRPAHIDLEGIQQLLLEKQELNLFTNPNLPELLRRLNADQYVVYGVVTEFCVRFAAMGLLEQGKPVSLVSDAIQSLDARESDFILQEFERRGGFLKKIDEVCTNLTFQGELRL